MRVFVTGGTGLIGRHVISALVRRGDAVTALARSATAAGGLRELGADPVRGDLADAAGLEAQVAAADAVVHCAAMVIAWAGWAGYYRANVVPTERIARLAARHGARMVHLSSVAVYGRRRTYDGGPGSVSEEFGLDGPLFPGDHYSRSKREAELALWRVAGETALEAVALRPCVVYGEGDRHFSPRVARVLRRGLAPLVGEGRNTFSVVYAGNVAAAVVAALDRPEVVGAFNVANDGEVTVREFVTRFAEGMRVRLRVVRIPESLAWRAAAAADAVLGVATAGRAMMPLKSAVRFLARDNPFSSARAERELGWRPSVPPAAAAAATGRWFAVPTAPAP